MGRRKASLSPVTIIDPQTFGVSFSIKQCRNFGIDPRQCLRWLINDAGFRRFRLMSYWDEHEKSPGEYDFSELDWQLEEARNNGCLVTLCVGVRQPRWPENHWPQWAWELPKHQRTEALLRYIQAVVERYRHMDVIVSYQLENEALLKRFGERPEINRRRLRKEFKLVKQLDPQRPVIMSMSTPWGLPWRKPLPDILGFSLYNVVYAGGRYRSAHHSVRWDRIRSVLGHLFHDRPSFIHELQLEPWGPMPIWEMPIKDQNKSMSTKLIRTNVAMARRTKLAPIDLWGGEWWYWRYTMVHDPTIWLAVQNALLKN